MSAPRIGRPPIGGPAEGARPTFAEIDLSAVQSNFRAIRALAPPGEFICPMVKADAYGHGDVECARALRAAGAEHLGVALFEEAAKLREAGDVGSLLAFGPFFGDALEGALRTNVVPVIGSLAQLREFAKAASRLAPILGRAFSFHLEFNTGMNRLGLDPGEAKAAREAIDACSAARLDGVCTHFACGDDAGEAGGASSAQFAEFRRALDAFSGLRFRAHALNSSASINLSARAGSGRSEPAAIWPTGLRPGIAIYGSKPPTASGASTALIPAMTLKTSVVQLRRVPAGARVSYGGRWQARRPSLIGVLPAGYADGYFRALSNKGAALVRGLRAPIAGTVCMDYSMVDLTDVEAATGEIAPGEEAILFGRSSASPNGAGAQTGVQTGAQIVAQIEAQELADAIGTIPYEIFTSVSARVPRVFVGGDLASVGDGGPR